MRVDGSVVTGLRSMVVDAYTQYNQGGIGVHHLNRGNTQLVSIFTISCDISIMCETGGFCSLTNSNTSFGDFGMYASGSRFITGSGGNLEAFNRVRDGYTIIIDTIEDGLSAIPEFVPNTNAGVKVTDELQQFSSNNSSDVVAEQAKSEYRLVSNIVSSGINNIPSLLAKSATRGYNSGSVWNISFGNQITSSTSATSTELDIIDDRFGKILVSGLGVFIIIQAFTNISVATQIIPVTGQNLPLISSGGSSAWMTCISLGMILSVSSSIKNKNGR